MYLEQQAGYRSLLAAPLTEDITPLFEFAARERETAYRTLMEVMGSGDYDAAMQRWRSSVEDERGLGMGAAGRGARPVAGRSACCKEVPGGAGAGGAAAEPEGRGSLSFPPHRVQAASLPDGDPRGPDARGQGGGATLEEAPGRVGHESRTLPCTKPGPRSSPRPCPRPETAARCRPPRCWCRACGCSGNWHAARVPELFAQFSRSLRETEPPYVMLLPWLRRITS